MSRATRTETDDVALKLQPHATAIYAVESGVQYLHLLNDCLCATGLALNELIDHLHRSQHLICLALHTDLPRLALREVLQPSGQSLLAACIKIGHM